jgi:uncharacterized protein
MNQSLILPPKLEESNVNPAVSQKQLLIKQLIILGLEMFLALPLGLTLLHLHVGGIAWIFGGVASGMVILQTCRIFYKYSPKPNRTARKVGMGLVGLTVGASTSQAHLASVASGVPVFVLLTLFLLISGSIIGYLYSRLSRNNLLTSMLATVPGGVGVMSSIAADYGRNVPLVALVQALRVTTVVLLIPFIARTLMGDNWNPQTVAITSNLFSFDSSQSGLLFLALLFTGLIVYLSILFKIPAGDFFGALLLGIIINPLLHWLPLMGDIHFNPPQIVNIVGQILLGITIGEYWGEKPSFSKRTVVYAFMSVALTILTGAIAAFLAMHLTPWDWLTCLLVTAPGGAAEMILVALTLNHNVEIVTTGHLIRLIAINSSLPIWVFLFRRLDSQLSSSS